MSPKITNGNKPVDGDICFVTRRKDELIQNEAES